VSWLKSAALSREEMLSRVEVMLKTMHTDYFDIDSGPAVLDSGVVIGISPGSIQLSKEDIEPRWVDWKDLSDEDVKEVYDTALQGMKYTADNPTHPGDETSEDAQKYLQWEKEHEKGPLLFPELSKDVQDEESEEYTE